MVSLKTPNQIKHELRDRARQRRLDLELTQTGLAARAGVSLGTLKKFEATGDIALETLLKLAAVLDGLDDFTKVLPVRGRQPTLDELLEEPKQRKRGSIS